MLSSLYEGVGVRMGPIRGYEDGIEGSRRPKRLRGREMSRKRQGRVSIQCKECNRGSAPSTHAVLDICIP